jgi:hypothetical protein
MSESNTQPIAEALRDVLAHYEHRPVPGHRAGQFLARHGRNLLAALSEHGGGGEADDPYKAALRLPWVIGETYTTVDIPGLRIPCSYRLEWIDRSESSLAIAVWRDLEKDTLHLQNLRDFQPPEAATTPSVACEACGRAVLDRHEPCAGFLTPCGRRLARLEDCGKVDCVEALAAAPGEGSGECATCNGVGIIGGPSYREPDEGGVPCPDCSTPPPASQSAPTNPTEIGSKSVVAPSDGGGELPEGWQVTMEDDPPFPHPIALVKSADGREAFATHGDGLLYEFLQSLAAPTPEQR